MLMDLVSLHRMGSTNVDLLKKIDFDFRLLDRAEHLACSLDDLRSQKNVEKKEVSKTRILRDKVYTRLKQVVDEIRRAGRFVFHNDKEKLVGYRSAFLHRKNLRRRTRKQAPGEVVVPVEATDALPAETGFTRPTGSERTHAALSAINAADRKTRAKKKARDKKRRKRK